jgi:hypothetical protein
VPNRVATSYVVRTRVVQSYSKKVQFLPTCCEQRVTYLVIGISDLELESTFVEQGDASEPGDELLSKARSLSADSHPSDEASG